MLPLQKSQLTAHEATHAINRKAGVGSATLKLRVGKHPSHAFGSFGEGGELSAGISQVIQFGRSDQLLSSERVQQSQQCLAQHAASSLVEMQQQAYASASSPSLTASSSSSASCSSIMPFAPSQNALALRGPTASPSASTGDVHALPPQHPSCLRLPHRPFSQPPAAPSPHNLLMRTEEEEAELAPLPPNASAPPLHQQTLRKQCSSASFSASSSGAASSSNDFVCKFCGKRYAYARYAFVKSMIFFCL